MLLRVTVRPSCSNIVLKRLNTSNVLHILLAHLPSFLATKYFDEIPTGPDANRSSCVNGQIHRLQTFRRPDRILAIRQKTRAMCKRSRDRYFMGYFFYIF